VGGAEVKTFKISQQANPAYCTVKTHDITYSSAATPSHYKL